MPASKRSLVIGTTNTSTGRSGMFSATTPVSNSRLSTTSTVSPNKRCSDSKNATIQPVHHGTTGSNSEPDSESMTNIRDERIRRDKNYKRNTSTSTGLQCFKLYLPTAAVYCTVIVLQGYHKYIRESLSRNDAGLHGIHPLTEYEDGASIRSRRNSVQNESHESQETSYNLNISTPVISQSSNCTISTTANNTVSSWDSDALQFPHTVLLVGGRTFTSMSDRFSVLYPNPHEQASFDTIRDWEPLSDYGGLNVVRTFQRRIKEEDEDLYDIYRDQILTFFDEHVTDPEEWYDFFDDLDHPIDCVRPTWSYQYYPTCHTFHETVDESLRSLYYQPADDSIAPMVTGKFLGRGAYRVAFLFQNRFGEVLSNQQGNDTLPILQNDEGFVLKHLQLSFDHTIGDFEQIKVEALLMEQLSSSPSVLDIYGHCGTSTMVEAGTEISSSIVPFVRNLQTSRGRMKQTVLDELELNANDVHPMNNLTNKDKLGIAIGMIEGIANLHGFHKGVIVHDDIHSDQWLAAKRDGRIALNDINNAQFLRWNYSDESYCLYQASYDNPFHSPEQYDQDYGGGYVDESSDIWAVGHLIFGLLTGLWPYYMETTTSAIKKLALDGIKPYLNPSYRNHSYVERRMIEIMERCYVREPADRVTIFDILEHLRETNASIHKYGE